MIYKWKITDIAADGELITHAKYHVTLTDEDKSVETEGYWTFFDQTVKTPFAEITEELVAQWIVNDAIQDGVCVIKSNLERQLAYLTTQQTVVAPWMPQVFTPRI